MKKNSELEVMLLERERRDKFELDILNSYENTTLITIKSNYPGKNKNTFESHYVCVHFFKKCKSFFPPLKVFSRLSVEGLLLFILTTENPNTVKQKTILLEDTEMLGRFIDIDVRTKDIYFSRADFNIPPRKCYICDKNAVICVRNRTHQTESLCNFFYEHVKMFLFFNCTIIECLSNIVFIAMLEELCREYSFGCVNANTSGSHTDMDFFLMLEGIEVVSESVKALNEKTTKSFFSLREHGKIFEKKLFEKCNGINTYKGAHFLILILSAAVLNCTHFKNIPQFITKFSQPCKLDFNNANLNKPVSSSEYFNHFALGIRNEALTGFKNHFDFFLPLLEKGASDLELTTKILEYTYDTTTIKRGNLFELKKIQSMAKRATSKDSQKKIHEYCIQKKLSTGGVADNFIITKMLFFIKNFLF